MQNNLKTFEDIEEIIDNVAERQKIQGIISFKLFRDYLHFYIYAYFKNEYYNKEDGNTNSIYSFAQNYTDKKIIDGRDEEAFYKYSLGQYKNVINNKLNYDRLKSTTGTHQGRDYYSLSKQDAPTFDCILKINSPINNTNIRSTYRKYCLQKFSKILFEDMEEMYNYFINNMTSFSNASIRNLEGYKIESAMRFETIKYALTKISQFELKSNKDNLKEKMKALNEIIVYIFKKVPSPFRRNYIDYFCKIANDMNENKMDCNEYVELSKECIQQDCNIILKIVTNVLNMVFEYCNEEIIAKGIEKYSQIFNYDFFKNSISIVKDFSKKHYKSLMEAFEQQYNQDKKLINI